MDRISHDRRPGIIDRAPDRIGFHGGRHRETIDRRDHGMLARYKRRVKRRGWQPNDFGLVEGLLGVQPGRKHHELLGIGLQQDALRFRVGQHAPREVGAQKSQAGDLDSGRRLRRRTRSIFRELRGNPEHASRAVETQKDRRCRAPRNKASQA